jgi:hypothetical protein
MTDGFYCVDKIYGKSESRTKIKKGRKLLSTSKKKGKEPSRNFTFGPSVFMR